MYFIKLKEENMLIKKILICIVLFLCIVSNGYCSDFDVCNDLFKNEKFKEALSYAEKIIKEDNKLNDSKKVDVLIIAGKCCHQLWKIDNAIEYFNQALNIKSEKGAEIIILIAETYFLNKDYKNSELNYKKVIQEFPDSSQLDKAYFYLAKSLKYQNKINEAKQYLIKLIDEYPESKYLKKAKIELKNI